MNEDFSVVNDASNSESEACQSVFYQKETVCVPVKVTPYAKPGVAKATCCGAPDVSMGNVCTGTQRACVFTLHQNLCVEIPVSFGADIETGIAAVSCGEVSNTPCDCGDEDAADVATDTATDTINDTADSTENTAASLLSGLSV
jgi:hypothetical protein